ncbi:MAG: tRNA pseudouridine(55) synthase TruB [Pseudomonadota bacterium]|nr:tRNA pseudouridine(55) synthase TruB [Pseudomonadota bacterium]MDE3038306.1 tRNA pseudouridine(55) synthase TruB [Pseudomonadota bacterium]
MHGWIILDKPSGITSAHAVAKVKKILRHPTAQDPAQPLRGSQDDKIKIGHAGTLDPLASGVLPLALGEATKTIPYMMDADKEYAFTVTWGEERDTDDSAGKIINKSEKIPEKSEINAIIRHFIGKIMQLPPAYSALKIGGERAYDLARNGIAPDLKAREVRVDFLSAPTLLSAGGAKTDFRCACGKGTYIRSLARDMGRELGCFGYISRLRRTRVGKFDQTGAISLEMLEEMVHKGGLGFLQPLESALDDIPAIHLAVDQAARLQRGQNVVLPLNTDSSTVIARCNGKPVAVCKWKDGQLWPTRVFNL